MALNTIDKQLMENTSKTIKYLVFRVNQGNGTLLYDRLTISNIKAVLSNETHRTFYNKY